MPVDLIPRVVPHPLAHRLEQLMLAIVVRSSDNSEKSWHNFSVFA
jgi:hypothetical protein